jgi:arginase
VNAEWTLLGAPLDSSGAGRGEERAPRALRAAGLAERLGLLDAGDVVPPLRDTRRDAATGVIAAAQLVEASRELRDAVAGCMGRRERPFVLGGDCSLLPGALAGARLSAGPMSLWMIDGHPDALDGETSPTGEAADMDLAIVLGRGHPGLTSLVGTVPIVEPENVTLVGHRPAELDREVAAELALVPTAIEQTTAPELRSRGAGRVAWTTLTSSRGRPAWLHLDLDALDEREFPAVTYPQPQGLSWLELLELLEPLMAAPDLIGISLADLDADHAHAHEHAAHVVEMLDEAFPESPQRTKSRTPA